MVRVKHILAVFILSICTLGMNAQSHKIKKDISDAFSNGDTEALSRAMYGFTDLVCESETEPGFYVIDTLAVLDILSHIEKTTEDITYTSDSDSRIAADMLNSLYYASIGQYDSAIIASKRIIDYLERNRSFDKNLYCSILNMLSGYYNEVQDYESSLLCAKKILKYIKTSDMLFYDTSLHVARSEFGLGNIKSAYKYIRIAYNHPETEYQSYRGAINASYVEILQSLANSALSNNNSKKFAEYYEELLSIFRDYPDTNVSMYLEDEFIVATFTTLLNKGYKKEEINKYIDIIAKLRHESFVRFASYDYNSNDGIALIVRSWGEKALNAEKSDIARYFFDYAYDLSEKGELSEDVAANINSWYAYFHQYVTNNHILAFDAYKRSLETCLKNNDKTTTEENLKYLLNILDESISHIRYFYAKPKEENGIFILSFSDSEYILKQWEVISQNVISRFGNDYFTNILNSYRYVQEDLRVFQLYSASDNILMHAHNFIRNSNYSSAFKLINDLIVDESLDDDKVIEIIWRIDNNLYLNTGYNESDIFLRKIREANFVRNKPEVISWIDRERERIKNWLGYKLGYAHSLIEEGNTDDAMKEYDNILSQIPHLENPDSLYLETQMMRAIDLCYYAKKYDDALLVSKEVNNVAVEKVPHNYLVRSNSLFIIAESLRQLEKYSEALPYSEENINLLKQQKVDEDGHHLLQALQQYGDINLNLKNYDFAEQAYLTCLSNHDEYNLVLLVTNLAQIYGERLRESIKLKDGKLCLEMYYKAINLLKSYPTADPGLTFYFSPLSEQLKDILSIIPADEITKLCDDIIALDLLVNGSKTAMGENSEIHPLQWHANVIQNIASRLDQIHYYHKSILYYNKAIDFVLNNNQHYWGHYLSDLYTDRSNTKEMAGEWVSAINDRILSIKSLQNSNDSLSAEIGDSFCRLKTDVNIALATKTSYAIAIYDDSYHPHLKYEDCLKILDLWRECLTEVLYTYGPEYLDSLQNYLISSSEKSYYEQYKEPMPYSVTDRMTLLSEIDYIKCNIDINENRLNDFIQDFTKLWDNLKSFDKADDCRMLRFNIVKDIASTLSHAGYTDWSFRVLEGYFNELITNDKDYELAEKVTTEMGILAYNIGDFSRLINCTRFVDTEFISDAINNKDYSIIWLPFYDINELIQQLMLLSRLQKYIGDSDAPKTLYYAKGLVDNNKSLLNGNHVTAEVAANLYNELAIIEKEPQKSIELYKKSLEFNDKFDYGTTLNLASQCMSVGKFSEADSLLQKVYAYSKENYMEPRWKSLLYRCLTDNSVQCGRYDEAREYSQERLGIQSYDYLLTSQSLTSAGRSNYWDTHYSSTLTDASTTDLACGANGSNSYNAALFQKSILIRQKSAIKNNIIQSNDRELIETFDKYNREIRSHSDSASITEDYCMYLYSLHPEFVGSFSIPKWQDVQATLGKRDLALEYTLAFDESTHEYYYAAILLGKSYESPIIVKLCNKDDLISLNKEQLDNAGFSISMFQNHTALYNLIWEPIEDYLRGVKNIYYSPYEFINNLNVEAACNEQGGRPIGFKFKMVRVSTTADLVPSLNTTFTDAVVFGDIDYDALFKSQSTPDVNKSEQTVDHYVKLRGGKHESWNRLVHAAREVEGINMLLHNNDISTTLYTNDLGTEEAFKSLSGNAPDILHLATHGFYYTSEEAKEHEYFTMSDKSYYESGVRSGIVLTSGNYAWRGKSVPPGAEDGILTADEISGIDLSETGLITLSACQTALGDIASDGVYGIQRSFKIAGVDTIIMSLWQVDDEATYMMMEKFYQELTNGKDKREAFRIAQLFVKDWAEKRVKELKDSYSDKIPEIQEKMKAKYGGLLYPEYYWAAFVMLD